ncbi:MAG: hypothetical protein H0Z29_09995 [Candidatus Marinimicrobia bacterium]|nr:hypothetical protein [Candidatus Neomarinimicrobiota bacterium]
MRALALFSGGLDSLLAVKIVQSTGIEVIPVFFNSLFFNKEKAEKTARENNLNLVIVELEDDYLDIIKNPKYGYGKNMNPCIDCHGFMFKKLGELLKEFNADFLISGEVLGQRPFSQTLPNLNAVKKLSGYEDLIVRPLSQKLLPDTKPIREGWIKKHNLYDIQGRGRKRQFELAKKFGLKYPPPAGGCLLTDPSFSQRLNDLIKYSMYNKINIELLKLGRHLRIDKNTKLIIGRNREECEKLKYFVYKYNFIIVEPSLYKGPSGMIIFNDSSLSNRVVEESINLCGSIILSYTNKIKTDKGSVYFYNDNYFSTRYLKKFEREKIEKFLINR